MTLVLINALCKVKHLVEEHGADTNMPMAWVMCDMIEFAAGKGHLRVLKYLLEKTTVDKLNARAGSNFSLITAVDRAAKAGHLECLKAIKEFGGIIDRRRRNGMNTAHGAAMYGHQETLEWLQVRMRKRRT